MQKFNKLKPDSSEKRALLLFFGIYCLVMVFLFWRCRFGFAYEDETFYLAIPHRFCLGDRPLLQEWHLSQLFGLILYPFVKLYLALFHGTDGIVLSFRYLYTAVWGVAGLFIGHRLKRFSLIGSMAAALCFVVYAPWSVMALSYQSMSFLFLLLACVILITTENPLPMVAAGILYAGSVLCNPYLVLLYPLFTIVMLVLLLFGRRELSRIWLFLTLGILAVLVVFAAILLSGGKISDYIRVLPMLMDDPLHEIDSQGFFRQFTDIVRYTVYVAQDINPFWKASVGAAVVITVAAMLTRAHKIGFLLICADSVFLLMSYHFGYHTLNFLMFPACFVGAYCFLCGKDGEIGRLFWGIWVPGLLYAFCHMFASVQRYLAFSHACGVMMVASLVMGARYVKKSCEEADRRGWRIALSGMFCVLLLCQFTCELSARYHLVYWDKDISFQTILAEEGPEKGILMSQDAYEYYDTTVKDIRVLCEGGEVRKVLFLTKFPWLYLIAQKEYSTFSPWEEPVDAYTVKRLREYYSLYPEKIPDAVFFDRDYVDLIPEFEKDGYVVSDENTSQYAVIMRRKSES